MESDTIEFTMETTSSTEDFARGFGAALRGGEVIELIGDVGAGKTTFVRGMAAGMGSGDKVTSPTFTVSQVYEAGDKELHHYDFYRISDYEIIRQELKEVLESTASIIVMEWAQELAESLGDGHVRIQFIVTGEDSRKLVMTLPRKYNYLGVSG